MITLRPYQEAAVNAVFDYFAAGRGRAPLLSLPTGSGKSVIQAAFLQRALAAYPGERFLLVSHVKELLEQNAAKVAAAWPDGPAPLGIYSAGLGRRDTHAAITVAGIQSVYQRAQTFGDVGLLIVDEAHLVPRDGAGMYLTFVEGLRRANPDLCILGMTATPYRLDSGPLYKGENAIFDGVAYEADLLELVCDGYLCPLRSRIGVARTDLQHLHVRGGEFIPAEVEAAMNVAPLVEATVNEIVELAGVRRKMLIFCCGVEHAATVAATLRNHGVAAECVTGDMPPPARDGVLERFRSGAVRALTNVNVLTTGFDAPDIDTLVMLRPTLSTGLYVQMCGRGMRTAPGKTDCLLLDFAGNVLRHGPLTAVRPRAHAVSSSERDAAYKECPRCHGVVAAHTLTCPGCGHKFERAPAEYKHARNADLDSDVMGVDNIVTASVDFVEYSYHGRLGKTPSMRVTYYCHVGGDADRPARRRTFDEWVCVEHPGYPGEKAQRWLRDRGAPRPASTVDEALEMADTLRQPAEIIVDTSEKYPRIITHRGWREAEDGAA